MAIVDMASKSVAIKIVYYGCAMGGKTTNLELLQRLTDPQNAGELVSVATKDDRTLLFDLLPIDLGQIGGLTVRCKLYTVPGQVHYETTRRQVLAGADGVVLVVDSSSAVESQNTWAEENLRFNLKAHGFDPESFPCVLQWNKRDLPDARPVAELEQTLNTRGRPTHEAVAVQGQGVVETFGLILVESIFSVYAKTSSNQMSRSAIKVVVDRALGAAMKEAAAMAPAPRRQFEQRFDMGTYQDEQADQGRAKQIVDEGTLLSESVKANIQLAERLDDLSQVQSIGERRESMMKALSALVPQLSDPRGAALPGDVLPLLLAGAHRSRGSLLFFKPKADVMEERQRVPDAPDLLNGTVSPGLGSVAYRFAKEGVPKAIDDLMSEVFFGQPPAGAEVVQGARLVPIQCDGLKFGCLVVYSGVSEPLVDAAEAEFWSTAGSLLSLSLHWRALRSKLQAKA